MPVINRKKGALCRLDKLINDGKKVLVFDYGNLFFLGLLRKGLNVRNVSDVEIWQYIEDAPDYVSKSDLDEVLKAYRLYDFSDRVLVISDSEQHGSLFHYVKNGILTEEEMVDALLYGL